ncbi:hypothetical protein B0T10DRAFT_54163 [Thelonectria olida]|uniref:Uncharacterized protein n=1 Tax=Thelonectria olida TaxID=1576542 RepID=A0A9P8W583_9HYPO|nr:hypothetical protein B0T10DRAFT_54163 [Thelonectria olida]
MPPRKPTSAASASAAASSSSAWVSAPPTAADGFAFAHGDFFAEASGQNRHRRATPAEVREHFASGSDKDHPAHWFEAQLVHYGLQPSKTKSVARMRLFDAVNAGKLTVPAHMTTLEGKLKREWNKSEKEAKKRAETKKTAETKPTAKKTEPTKPGPKAKAETKARATGTTAKPETKKKTERKKTTEPKPAAGTKRKATTNSTPSSRAPKKTKMATSTARTTAADPPTAPTARPKQTARRGGSFARGRSGPPEGNYSIYDDDEDEDSHRDYDSGDSGCSSRPDDGGRKPCPMNGSYELECPDVESQWPHYGSDFELNLAYDGRFLWGKFDLGVVEGVLRMENPPKRPSTTPAYFTWRGREDEGQSFYGENHRGWIKFLPTGGIEGYVDYQGISFTGRRDPEVSDYIRPNTVESEWDNYTEDLYEYERVSRWGGSRYGGWH